MARWLVLAVSDNGDLKGVVVNDTSGTNLPFGDHSAVIERLDDCSELTAIIELPEGDFRPEVIDPTTDSEAPMTFLDL